MRACYVGHHSLQVSEEPSFLKAAANRISTWKRLVRVVAKVIQSIRIWKNLKNHNLTALSDFIHNDICDSEKRLVKEAQKEFAEEIILLSDHKPVPKSSTLYKLPPYVDEDGISRLGGRTKLLGGTNPIILPRSHRISHLVVLDFHVKYHHGNNETVVNELRQRFWIPKSRETVWCFADLPGYTSDSLRNCI